MSWIARIVLPVLGLAASASAADHPPIPITFQLDQPAHVTLVIEDAAGKRVRNLVAETPYAAGAHTVWWDGLDETPGNFRGPVYEIQGKPVAPGRYQVRGLRRDALTLNHEFTVYNAGQPSWRVGKHGDVGEWLADHSAPSAVLHVPAEGDQPARMLIGSQVAEQGDGLVWTDLAGRKQRGAHGVGGAWTGAHFLARDEGAKTVPGVYAYTASTWKARDETKMELRLLALQRDGKTPALVAYQFERDQTQEVHGWDTEYNYLGGIAARDGVVLVGFQRSGTVLVVDAAQKKLLSTLSLPDVRGMAFDGEGRLLVLSGTRLLRAPPVDWRSITEMPALTTLVETGLDDPRQVIAGPDGRIYLTDRGRSHCVKVFAADGAFVRTIGKAGTPTVGFYDPARMQNPQGLSFSGDGTLWVAEEDHAPKRVSVWGTDGVLRTAFYGPAKYGGGGNLSADRTRFYYHDSKNGTGGGMEFALDWQAGTWRLHSTYHRFAPSDQKIPANLGYAGPQLPIDLRGVRYLTNAFNTNPTQGTDLVGLWRLHNGVAKLLAVVGDARDWPLMRTAPFAPLFPKGLKDRPVLIAWSDIDDDGAVEADEVQARPVDGHTAGTWYVGPDLALMNSSTARLVPARFTAGGAPVYDLATLTPTIPGVTHRYSSGGAESFPCGDWTIVTGGPMRGYRGGDLVWTYPSRWPSLHASHEAPRRAQLPGELIGTTRLLGHPVRPRAGEAGEVWAINGNPGVIHLLTSDGLYVGTLGRDRFQGKPWPATETRGADLSDVWFFDEHFWPTINQGADGQVHLLIGKNHNSIVRIDGLESVRRLPVVTVEVTADQLAAAETWRIAAEQRRQQGAGRQTLTITLRDQPPVVDGDLGEWDAKRFVTIYRDKLGGREVAITGALAVHGERLFVAVRGCDDDLLGNTGDTPTMAFKTGGALDLMLGVDGNQRLLVTRQQGRTLAMRYRQRVAGTPDDQRVPFSSPTRTVWFDRVEDVSAVVTLAAKKDGYEFSIPLATLALSAVEGTRLTGDLGVLRGSQGQTHQRLYWHNQATSITADVPSEAMLTPALWGDLVFAR